METFEDLGAAIGTVEFDREALIGRAVSGGRRRQRRRRLAAGAGVLALGALVVGSGMRVAGSSVDEDSGVTTQPTATPSAGRSGLPSAELTDSRLVDRLPVPGDLVSAEDLQGAVLVERAIDPDGSGAGTVTLSLLADGPLPQQQISGEAAKCRIFAHSTGPERCRRIEGGWLFTVASPSDQNNASAKALDWSVTVIRKDGYGAQVHATNFVHQKHPTRAEPVLDLDQIEQLATDTGWFDPVS